MQIEIIDHLEEIALGACDFSFTVSCEAVPPFGPDSIQKVVPVTPYRKRYDVDPRLFTSDGADGDRLLAVARTTGRITGYILAYRSWNNFASIEDFAVDGDARRDGAGRLLMDAVANWATKNGFRAIRAETQSNNVPACRFYQRYGYKLGGSDRFLYAALQSFKSESALFWYLFLDPEAISYT